MSAETIDPSKVIIPGTNSPNPEIQAIAIATSKVADQVFLIIEELKTIESRLDALEA